MYSLLSDIPDAKLVEENKQLQSKLEEANATVKQEQTKVKDLTIENAKHKYRILHLVRALKDADQKLERLSK
ncbi:unnamed protein product [Arabidopsis thaliana]|uniref:(thale cress) hypothetical protein n=1 Tax=Arabidopsis thaliana TaxID=3702 RepID=A0A7G2ERY0_ARATH|nr:unnamed protein product [Arabidopsis thaliana]